MGYQTNGSQFYGSGQGQSRSGYQNRNYQGGSSQFPQNGFQGTQMTNVFDANMVQQVLTKQLQDHKKALPQGFPQERFVFNCMSMIMDMTKDRSKMSKLQNVRPETIAACFLKGAILGLDFFNGECYAIPYGNDMQFQTDYKGEIKVCKKHSKNPIKDIYAKVVREGDEFYEEIDGGDQRIYFKPLSFSNAPMVGAFAVVKFADGSMMYETMSAAEIEEIRNGFSKAKDSPAWTKTPGEMYKKTVLRRLCKFIDLDFDMEQYKAFDEGGDVEFNTGRRISADNKGQTVNVFQNPVQPQQIPQIQDPVMPKQEVKQTKEPVMSQEAEYAAFDKTFQEGNTKQAKQESDEFMKVDEDSPELPFA